MGVALHPLGMDDTAFWVPPEKRGRLTTLYTASETGRAMRANHLPAELVPITLSDYLSPGYGFGLGFATLADEDMTPEPDNNGMFRWSGPLGVATTRTRRRLGGQPTRLYWY